VLAAGALGIIGAGGEADRMYAGVLAVLVVGSAVVRLRASGMAFVLAATAGAQVLVTLIVFATGQHENEGASAVDILMINAMYVALWLAAAWLFRRSTDAPRGARAGAAAH
jgi:hypothetical protein